MGKHTTLSVCDYNRRKLCDLYDSHVDAQGQAYDIAYTKEVNGWKEISFTQPLNAGGERNFRWNYIKNERQLRYTEGDTTEWFQINSPVYKHDNKVVSTTISCDHISAVQKNKNLYLVFDDKNGIGTIKELATRALVSTGWTLGHCDIFYESDGVTEKIRTIRSDGKLGAYQLIQNICTLFAGYPEFDGDTKQVHLYCLNRRNRQMEQVMGKNIVSMEKKVDSDNVVTRLYVEGEYTDDGYVGIDDVNPTGLPFLLNFDYYKEVGMFTEEHQLALDKYLEDIRAAKQNLMELAVEKSKTDNRLNELWGQVDYVLFPDTADLTNFIFGGDAFVGDEVFTQGNEFTVLHDDYTYSQVQIGEDKKLDLTEKDVAVIKWVTRAAGLIGGKEVAIEAKEKVIKNLEKDLQKTYVSESEKENIRKQIGEIEDAIALLYTGTEEAPGLYTLMFEAVGLAVQASEQQKIIDGAGETQNNVEIEFVEAMGDMLKDGYWSDTNYVVGQEKNLYTDALAIMEDLSKPAISYVLSTALLKKRPEYAKECYDLNTSIRMYDPEMDVNDFVYVSKVIHHPEAEDKDTIEVSNEYINITGKTFESVLTRITQLADVQQVRKTLYERAEALNGNGTVPALRLEGTIDIMKSKLFSSVSNWYTDENGNIIFEAVNGKSAMQLCGEGFMIANGKTEDGEWNWRTFGTGEGFTADAIVTGYLSADRIEAGSISATKLDGTVGAMIDLSDNESIKMIVKESANIIRSDVEPEQKVDDMIWIDTSGDIDVMKRWDEERENWVECTQTQDDLILIDRSLSAHESLIYQMDDEIQTKVSSTVYANDMAGKADTNWVTNQMDSMLRQTASDIAFQFNEAKTYTANSVGPLEEFKETVTTWQKFSSTGQELGKSNSPFKVKLDNEQLSFLQDNSTVAYINNNKMHITQARVTETQSIGTEDNGYFDWVTTSDGLALKWRS